MSEAEKALERLMASYSRDVVKREIRRLLGLQKGQRAKKGTLVEEWVGISIDEEIVRTALRDPLRAFVEEAKRRIRECPGQPIVQGGPDGELVEINRVIYVSDADAALDSMLEEKP